MPVIVAGTPYDYKNHNFLNAIDNAVNIITAWWASADKTTRVDVNRAMNIFKVGDNITVESGGMVFSSKISRIVAIPTNAYDILFLEPGIDYTKGTSLQGGIIYMTPEETIVPKKRNWLLIGAVALVVAGLLYWKFGRKGKRVNK